MTLQAGDTYITPDGITREVLYFNELCHVCNKSADCHHDLAEPHEFECYNPPRPAYGAAWWLMTEEESKAYFRSQLPSQSVAYTLDWYK